MPLDYILWGQHIKDMVYKQKLQASQLLQQIMKSADHIGEMIQLSRDTIFLINAFVLWYYMTHKFLLMLYSMI